jgi:3-oxoacyl-[acyl-carrier protein] reductase
MDLNLVGKTAIVTGGSRGLGKAICFALAEEGVNIVLSYVASEKRAQAVVTAVTEQFGGKAKAVKADSANEADVKALFAAATELTGTIDILVNNAGVCPIKMIKDTPLEMWQGVMDTNLTGVFLTCREMANIAIAQEKSASIVNITSQSAYNGSKRGKTHYAASKGGVVSFTVSFAQEVAKYGIRVNNVSPGMMYTDMTAGVLDAEEEKYNQQIPIGRIAKVEEVAKIVAIVSSDVSNYMTGSTVDISGGLYGR